MTTVIIAAATMDHCAVIFNRARVFSLALIAVLGVLMFGCDQLVIGGGVKSPETFSDYLRSQTIARPL
jgi:hypothetical protein